MMMLAVTNSMLMFCTGCQCQACHTYINNVYRQLIFHAYSFIFQNSIKKRDDRQHTVMLNTTVCNTEHKPTQ
jgi:hypothetical protein